MPSCACGNRIATGATECFRCASQGSNIPTAVPVCAESAPPARSALHPTAADSSQAAVELALRPDGTLPPLPVEFSEIAKWNVSSMVYSRTDTACSLHVLDQLKVPAETAWINVTTTAEAVAAIKTMQVRGAHALVHCGTLGLAVELFSECFGDGAPAPSDAHAFLSSVRTRLDDLDASRPTAVTLHHTIRYVRSRVDGVAAQPGSFTARDVAAAVILAAESVWVSDLRCCTKIATFGADWLADRGDGAFTLLTHCNTGSLATAHLGTALGIVRTCHRRGILQRLYATETRPYAQGARLTVYESTRDDIPSTLLCDSTAVSLLHGTVGTQPRAVVVGADRIAANGDTANKVGTFMLAVCAARAGVPFLVAAPITAIDPSLESGSLIPIEARPTTEVTDYPPGALPRTGVRSVVESDCLEVLNPSFDVTPADLITAIITDHGVIAKSEGERSLAAGAFYERARAGQQCIVPFQ